MRTLPLRDRAFSVARNALLKCISAIDLVGSLAANAGSISVALLKSEIASAIWPAASYAAPRRNQLWPRPGSSLIALSNSSIAGKQSPKNCIHIHGDDDRLLSHKNVKSDYTISKGSHAMIVFQAEEINKIIEKEIALI